MPSKNKRKKTYSHTSAEQRSIFSSIFKSVLITSLLTASLMGFIMIFNSNKHFQQINQRVLEYQNISYLDQDDNEEDIPYAEQLEIRKHRFEQDFIIYLIQSFLIATLVTIPISVLISYTLSTQITRPLKRLIKQLKSNLTKIGKDHAYKTLTPEGPTEIQALINNYNQLIKKLNKIDKLRHQLVQDISHELKTPLMKLQLNIEAIIDGINKPNKSNLKALINEIEQLKYLINRLQELIEISETSLNLQKINLYNFVNALLRTYNPSEKVELINKVTPNFEIKADPNRLRELFDNLITNALKNTKKGYIKVYTKADNIIIIEDTGIGIPKEYHSLIFERFYRVDHSRSKTTGGLGLGLSIVKEIIDLHNWSIRVKSKLNKGTKFIITVK